MRRSASYTEPQTDELQVVGANFVPISGPSVRYIYIFLVHVPGVQYTKIYTPYI